jgi:precorrin-3B synthase
LSGCAFLSLGWADTRDTARRIAAQLPFPGIESVHISGCTKGCARSAPADLVFVAEPSGFAIVRCGTAASAPQGVVPLASLDELSAILKIGL